MKWRTRKSGDTRTRRLFALIPRPCEDGYTRWLEWLDVSEVLHDGYDGRSVLCWWWEEQAVRASGAL